MENKSTQNQHATALSNFLKIISSVCRSLFESPDKKDFQRLKDFIAS